MNREEKLRALCETLLEHIGDDLKNHRLPPKTRKTKEVLIAMTREELKALSMTQSTICPLRKQRGFKKYLLRVLFYRL